MVLANCEKERYTFLVLKKVALVKKCKLLLTETFVVHSDSTAVIWLTSTKLVKLGL